MIHDYEANPAKPAPLYPASAHPLIGGAIGDSMGMPFETMAHDDPFLMGWDRVSFLPCAHHKLGPGQWTDDTQMTLCLAESLIEKGTYDAADVADRYLAWFQSGEARGVGGTVREAMRAFGEHRDVLRSGVVGGRGCGTAMRAMPLGVFMNRWFMHDADRFVRRDAQITHRSEEAEDASYVVAEVTHVLLSMAGREGEGGKGPSFMSPREYQNLVLGDVHECQPPGITWALVARAMKAETFEERLALGTSSRASEVVATALACLLFTDTFAEAVTQAILLGGDTDSRASIVGGWAGILRPIPEAWIAGVEDRERLLAIERRLLAPPPPLVFPQRVRGFDAYVPPTATAEATAATAVDLPDPKTITETTADLLALLDETLSAWGTDEHRRFCYGVLLTLANNGKPEIAKAIEGDTMTALRNYVAGCPLDREGIHEPWLAYQQASKATK